MKIYVDEMPKSCAECEFCGKLKPPAMQPDIECMHCNLMKKLNAISDFCPLKSLQSQVAEKDKERNKIAIEQLEKVRESLKHFCEIHSDEYYSVKSQVMGIYQDVCDFMDQQINELKGGVEDVED